MNAGTAGGGWSRARARQRFDAAFPQLNNMIGFAQALIAQARVMLAEDKYLNDAILTNSTGHLNQAVFNAGTNTVPNQDRLQLKINELEAEDKVMVAAFADIVPPRVTNLGA